MLAYADAGRAADWICTAFGFREVERYASPDGTVTDVVLQRPDGATVMVGHPHDAYEGPDAHAKHCAAAARWLDHPYIVDGVVAMVDDLDAHLRAAEAAGATILSGIETNPVERHYRAADLEGHRWMFAGALEG